MKIKQTLSKLPEFYFILVILLAGFRPPFSFHPLALIIATILILQIIFKLKISRLILGILFMLGNLFLLGALISEYGEFVKYTDDAQQLLIVGILFWIANVFFAGIMIYTALNLSKDSSHLIRNNT